jgi:hypothetical protein
MQVTWLASYPKSGSTWIRFLLTAYFCGDIQDFGWVSKLVLEFPNFYGQSKRAGESTEVLWQRLLKLSQELSCRPSDFPDDLFLKTHQTASADHPFLDRTRCAILVVRNPRDVAMSAINYLRLMGKRVIDCEKTYLQQFVSHRGDPQWKRHGYGTWEGHTHSWLEQRGFPVLLVKYEDLHANVVSEFERILRFIDAPIDHDRIVTATKLAEFQNLRKLETRRRGDGHLFPGHDKQLFMNRGEVRNSLATIDADLDQNFERTFQAGMKRFGYVA